MLSRRTACLSAGLLLFVVAGLGTLHAATYTVTSTSDDGSTGTLRWAINQANANSGSTIDLNNNLGTITLGSMLPLITTAVTINGGTGNTVSGNNLYRIFFVDTTSSSAAVNISNLNLTNGLAQGGAGGSGGGGGGLGAGGAIFVNSGAVTVSNVGFANNVAVGGAGGAGGNGQFGAQSGGGGGLGGAGGNGSYSAAAGGGGFGGAGGSTTQQGGAAGGGGLTDGSTNGTPGTDGGAGGGNAGSSGNPGGAGSTYGGGGGAGSSSVAADNGGAGGKFGGGGGSGRNDGSHGGNGGDFGGGGGATGSAQANSTSAGAGGWGGGGGGGAIPDLVGLGGVGGFGGGGGGSYSAVVAGGFLGGSSGSVRRSRQTDPFSISGGGGGGAAGANIFVRAESGGSLTIVDGSMTAGTVTGGAGGVGGDGASDGFTTSSSGTGAGSSLFLTGGTTTVQIDSGNTTYAGSIADAAAGGYAAVGLRKTGNGTLTLSGANNYAGTTDIAAGTIQFASRNAIYNGVGSKWNSDYISVASGATLSLNTDGGFTSSDVSHLYNMGSSTSGLANGSSFEIDTENSPFTLVDGLNTFNNVNVVKSGGNILTIFGNNSYTGNTVLNAGELLLQSAGAIGSGTIVFNGGVLAMGFNITTDYSSRFSNAAGQQYMIDSGALNLTYASALTSVGGSLTKLGNSTLTLTANETFTGTTTISAGSLQIGTGGSLASSAIVDNSLFAFNGSDATTVTGSISGSGLVTKVGTGSVTLSGTNTYTGATTVNSGTLSLQNSSQSSAFKIASGATLQLDEAGFTDNGSTTFTGTGTLLKSGAGTAIWIAGSATFALAKGSLIDVEAGSFAGASSNNEVWTNNLSGLNVADNASFSGAGGDIRVDALTGSGLIQSGVGSTGSITFGVADGSGTFAGSLTNNGVGVGSWIKAGTGTQTLTGLNTYTGATTISGGVLQIGNGSNTGSLATQSITDNAALAFDRNDAVTFAKTISGSGTLQQIGAGQLALTGTNTYTGGTLVQSGTLQFTNDANLGDLSSTLTLNGGTVNNTANLISTRQIILGAGGGTFQVGGFYTLTTGISGAGGLTQTGANFLTLTGAQTYLGATNVQGGTFKIEAGSLASSSVAVASGATFVFDNGGGTFAGSITGAGLFKHNGAGTIILTGTASHTGGTEIDSGTVQVGNGSTSGALSGAVTNNGTLAFNHSDTVTFAGTISGTGGVTQMGTGKAILMDDSSYSGGTTIAAGSLMVEGHLTGNGAVNVESGGSIGGDGSIGGSLHFDLGAGIAFDPTSTLTINGATVTFDGFSMADVIGLDSSTAAGTYTLLAGPSNIFDFANVSNVGFNNSYDLGNGKFAYFQAGSFDLVVAPEPSTAALAGLALLAFGLAQRHRRQPTV